MTRTEDIISALRTFSARERAAFGALMALFFLALLGTLILSNDRFSVRVPAHGGSLTEGIIGIPRFVNPLLANSDADRDLTTLVYSGLMRVGADGEIVPDLASKYDVRTDGLTYTFTLRDDLTWQDGAPLTAEDVVFTITRALTPALKSPRRAAWEGVTATEVDTRTVRFTLKQPFPSFLENATLGILPKHLWKNVSDEEFPFSELNTRGVGSGPFRVTSISRDANSIPTSTTLSSFAHFAGGEPYLSSLTFKFFSNESELVDALFRGTIESASALSPEHVSAASARGWRVASTTLPRVFAVFFNQSQNQLFTDVHVRKALDLATPKAEIVATVLHGYGTVIGGPLPEAASSTPSLEEAKKLLARALQKKGKKTPPKLAFTLTTADVPELRATAELLKAAWEKLGIQVKVNVFEAGDLMQGIVRPRKYEALLFGEIVGRGPDLFSFWHSSQRNDPGLNIALYTNARVDRLLEEARGTPDADARARASMIIAHEIEKDTPALFLYSPQFLMVVPKNLFGSFPTSVVANSDRLLTIAKLYRETDNVWNIFAPSKVR